MKKVWNDATLVELDITATAGSTNYNQNQDAPAYQDPNNNNYWVIPVGDNEGQS